MTSESADELVQLEKAHGGMRHIADGIIDFMAGTAGGVACVYVGQPLDTVKVKMQTFPHLYTNALKCFSQTLQKDGVRRGLYAGTAPALAANIAENSVLFAAYGFCQKAVAFAFGKHSVSELNPVQNALAGSLAAVFSTFTLCPTELIKCKLQAMREMHAQQPAGGAPVQRIGPWALTRQILRESGIRGLFRGFWPTFMREVPGYFFFFGGYEASRRLLTPVGGKKEDLGPLATCACGGIGGVSLWVAIFPFDVIKSRVQVQGKGNLVNTFFLILRTDGPRALYKGLGPTIIRSFFATGALFVAYEGTRKSLHGMSDPFF